MKEARFCPPPPPLHWLSESINQTTTSTWFPPCGGKWTIVKNKGSFTCSSKDIKRSTEFSGKYVWDLEVHANHGQGGRTVGIEVKIFRNGQSDPFIFEEVKLVNGQSAHLRIERDYVRMTRIFHQHDFSIAMPVTSFIEITAASGPTPP